MQFRESNDRRRTQCLAPEYDRESKRTRQKLVFTLDFHELAVSGKRPQPNDLRMGSPEQRQKWAKEISAYIDKRTEAGRQNAVRSGLLVIESLMGKILADLKSKTPILSEQDEERLADLIKTWAKELHIVLPSVIIPTSAQSKKKDPNSSVASSNVASIDPRAFDSTLVDMALEHRRNGLSIAATAARMTADGHAVSKSWVQKVTKEHL